MQTNRTNPALALVAAVCSFGIGCDRTATPPNSTSAGTPGKPESAEVPAVYIVRGQIEDLPDPSRPTSTFDVHHEAIDNFVGREGKVGMNSMTMTFPLGPGVSVAGLAIGDIVEMTFEVQWRPKVVYRATKVVKLPADTKLEYRAARPAGTN